MQVRVRHYAGQFEEWLKQLSEQNEMTVLQISDEASVGLRPNVWWK
jgi:hypothetical protein